MKNYFKFNLTGNKLLPVWLIFLVLIIAPFGAIAFQLKDYHMQEDYQALYYILPSMLFLGIIAFLITFYLTRLFIEGIEYNGQSLVFKGNIGQFVGIFLLNLLLSIVTLGIYTPWMVKNIQKFFVDHSTYSANPFNFKGKGGELFVIVLVTVIVPISVLVAFTVVFTLAAHAQNSWIANGVYQVVSKFVMIPYMYFLYKWMMNVSYKSYSITWKTDAWEACGKIFVQMLLTIITLGIYYPMAIIKLYHYFVGKTVAISDEKTKKFGYDMEPMADFLFLWGQSLLIIISLGIYYPWGACKMLERIMGKTYSENEVAA